MASGTPSAQFRIPLTGPLPSPPPLNFCSHHTFCGKNYPVAEKLSDGGVKNMQRRNIYPGRARVDQKLEFFFRKNLKVPKIVAQCRKHSIPYLNTLRGHSIFLYITKNNILFHCRNYTLS